MKERKRKKRWLFPKHHALFLPLSGKQIEDSETSSAFCFFSLLGSAFVKQAPNFSHSWFLVTGIAFSDTVFNVYEPEDRFSSRAHDIVKAQLKPPLPHSPLQQQQLIIGSTLQRAVQAQKSIWSPGYSSAKSFQGRKKRNMGEKREEGLGGWKGAGMRTSPSRAHKTEV